MTASEVDVETGEGGEVGMDETETVEEEEEEVLSLFCENSGCKCNSGGNAMDHSLKKCRMRTIYFKRLQKVAKLTNPNMFYLLFFHPAAAIHVLWHMHNAVEPNNESHYNLGKTDHTEVTWLGQRTTAEAWAEVNTLATQLKLQ